MKVRELRLVVTEILPEETNDVNGKTYTKRFVDFSDTDDHDYPADYRMELAPARYKLLEGVEAGDTVEVTCSITGKRGTKGVFHTLRLLELSIIKKASGQKVVRHSETVSAGDQFQQPLPKANEAPGFYAPAADDLPF